MATYQGASLAVCATVQPAPLLQAAFAALTFVNIGNASNLGVWGTKDNIAVLDLLNTDVSSKSKGVANGGDPTVSFERIKTDAGQIIMRTAGASKANYAFRLTLADGTIRYNRGVVSGPEYSSIDGPDSFDIENYILGLSQRTIEV